MGCAAPRAAGQEPALHSVVEDVGLEQSVAARQRGGGVGNQGPDPPGVVCRMALVALLGTGYSEKQGQGCREREAPTRYAAWQSDSGPQTRFGSVVHPTTFIGTRGGSGERDAYTTVTRRENGSPWRLSAAPLPDQAFSAFAVRDRTPHTADDGGAATIRLAVTAVSAARARRSNRKVQAKPRKTENGPAYIQGKFKY